MEKRMELSVVVPVYNGAKSLEKLCGMIFESAVDTFESCEIILVDDGSVDDSYEVMERLRENDDRIGLIKLQGNFGQQNATYCGILHAGGDYIATLDDDLQHPPALLSAMKDELDKGAELVFAIPKQRRQKRYRQMGSKMTYLLFNLVLGRKRFIKISSCRMFVSGLKDRLVSSTNEFVYVSAELLGHTDKIAWFEFGHAERLHGKSNYTFAKLLSVFIKLLVYYSKLGMFKGLRKKGPVCEIEKTDMGRDGVS